MGLYSVQGRAGCGHARNMCRDRILPGPKATAARLLPASRSHRPHPPAPVRPRAVSSRHALSPTRVPLGLLSPRPPPPRTTTSLRRLHIPRPSRRRLLGGRSMRKWNPEWHGRCVLSWGEPTFLSAWEILATPHVRLLHMAGSWVPLPLTHPALRRERPAQEPCGSVRANLRCPFAEPILSSAFRPATIPWES